ncbi:shikimate kinase [Halonatronum saccharophilum]|uniref:shikimate kinase n=1 Tax=Halonatronum saccharophilum TaxID=150060 RepID=UPI0004801ADB|nr:shikimate kinase [Halonatronum saccharophilum]
MNISLIGFMGTGKTSVAKILAKRLAYDLIDLDEEIVKRDGRSIPEIFAQDGEGYFRNLESQVTADFSKKDRQVISTGGGVVLRSENIDNLKKKGIVVLLEASAKEILKRTSNDNNRPLLNVEDPLAKIKSMLEHRRNKYDCTPYKIDTNKLEVEEVVEEIIKIVKN